MNPVQHIHPLLVCFPIVLVVLLEAGGFHSDIAETHEDLGAIVATVTVIYALVRSGLWWRDAKMNGLATIAAAFYRRQLVHDLGVSVQKVVIN